jgi:hypothetical protein
MGQEQVETVKAELTPQQWETLLGQVRVIHEIVVSMQRLVFPLSAGVITFDDYPSSLGEPIPSGTDLTQHALFSPIYGVTFSRIGGPPHQTAVYAVSDFITGNGNVVSVTDPGSSSGEHPWFTSSDGTIIASFAPPVRSVSIDAYPAALTPTPGGRPYIQGLDASGAEIRGIRADYPSSNLTENPQLGDVYTGPKVTLPISSPQPDIYAAEISLTNSDCEAVFDNLSYQR